MSFKRKSHKWKLNDEIGRIIVASLQDLLYLDTYNSIDKLNINSLLDSSYVNEELSFNDWLFSLNKEHQTLLLDFLEEAAFTSQEISEIDTIVQVIELLQNIQSNK